MFSFKYRPNDMTSEYRVTYGKEFERLDSCNAYTQFRLTTSNDNALHHTVINETFVLWSYAACILIVTILTDQTDRTIRVNVSVNEDAWNCSRSTIRHVSRFLDRITYSHRFGCGLSYHYLKKVMNSVRMHFFYDCPDWLEYHGFGDYQIDVPLTWHRYNEKEMQERLDIRKLARPVVERI